MLHDPKHTVKATEDFLKAKEMEHFFQWPIQLSDLSPAAHAFRRVKAEPKAERPTNKQQLKVAAVREWQRVLQMSGKLQSVLKLWLHLQLCHLSKYF